MADGVTQAQFYEEMQKLRADFQTMHTRLRDSVTDGFHDLGMKLDKHKEEDDKVEKRVLTLENFRLFEHDAAVKRGTWAGILAAIGAEAAIAAAKGSWWR